MQWFGCVTDCGLGLVSFVGIFVVVDWGCWYCLRKGVSLCRLVKSAGHIMLLERSTMVVLYDSGWWWEDGKKGRVGWLCGGS